MCYYLYLQYPKRVRGKFECGLNVVIMTINSSQIQHSRKPLPNYDLAIFFPSISSLVGCHEAEERDERMGRLKEQRKFTKNQRAQPVCS